MSSQNSTHISGNDSGGSYSATVTQQAGDNDDIANSLMTRLFTAAADRVNDHRDWLRCLTTNLHAVETRQDNLISRVEKLEEDLVEERRQRRALKRSLRQVGGERSEAGQQNGGDQT